MTLAWFERGILVGAAQEVLIKNYAHFIIYAAMAIRSSHGCHLYLYTLDQACLPAAHQITFPAPGQAQLGDEINTFRLLTNWGTEKMAAFLAIIFKYIFSSEK